MKILFLSRNFPPVRGGMEYVAENLLEGLRACGHVRALVPRADGQPDRAGVERAPGKGIAAYVRFVLRRGFGLCRCERPNVMLYVSVVPGLPADAALLERAVRGFRDEAAPS
jgi:hypothetical protein